VLEAEVAVRLTHLLTRDARFQQRALARQKRALRLHQLAALVRRKVKLQTILGEGKILFDVAHDRFRLSEAEVSGANALLGVKFRYPTRDGFDLRVPQSVLPKPHVGAVRFGQASHLHSPLDDFALGFARHTDAPVRGAPDRNDPFIHVTAEG
jgi:hypothetical protein